MLWAFSNPELNTQWSRVIVNAQTDLCKVVSKDCLLKVKRIENSITSLLQDLAGIVSMVDHQDITAELLQGFHLAVETKYAEKVLRRNKSMARGTSKPPKTKQQHQMASFRK